MTNSTQIAEELWTSSFESALIETETSLCATLKSDFYFQFHPSLSTKSASINCDNLYSTNTVKHYEQFLLHAEFSADSKTAKIGIRRLVKSDVYFRFVIEEWVWNLPRFQTANEIW